MSQKRARSDLREQCSFMIISKCYEALSRSVAVQMNLPRVAVLV